MWPFSKKKPAPLKNVYRVTYIPCAEVDDDKGEVVCRLCNMREKFVEAENLIGAQKAFAADYVLTPHVYINRIVEVIHRAVD